MLTSIPESKSLFQITMDDLTSKIEGFPIEIQFLFSISTVFFLFSVIQMISLLEVSIKEVMLRRSFSRFHRLCEECLFEGLSLGKLQALSQQLHWKETPQWIFLKGFVGA